MIGAPKFLMGHMTWPRLPMWPSG